MTRPRLLDLPTELLQLILLHTDAPTFVQAALSCRTLFEIASVSREAVLHHLNDTPGPRDGLSLGEWSTAELFELQRKWAASQLWTTSLADRTRFVFGDDPINARASVIPSSSYGWLALVKKGGSDVYLYHSGPGVITPRGVLKAPYQHPGKVEVLKVTISQHQQHLVSVLQRYTPFEEYPENDQERLFEREAMQPFRSAGVHLVHYNLENPADATITICALPHMEDYEPLSMAVANTDLAAISWQHSWIDKFHVVELYNVTADFIINVDTAASDGVDLDSEDDKSSYRPDAHIRYLKYSSTTLVDESGTYHGDQAMLRPSRTKGPVTEVAFGDGGGQLLYSYAGSTIYRTYQNLLPWFPYQRPEASQLITNHCMVGFAENEDLDFTIATPFFGTHRTYDASNGQRMCHWRYLTLGVATNRAQNWTVACLLSAEAHCREFKCGHVLNLDRGRRFNTWRIDARLWGFRKPNSSAGNIVATSPGGTRIAIANWDCVYIWVVEPVELLDGNPNGYYPESMTENGGSRVLAKPVILHLHAICFKLGFTAQENELMAVTDRGLMYWDLGPGGKATRKESILEIPTEVIGGPGVYSN